MDKQKQAFRVGTLAILLAVLLRMVCSGALGDRVALFSRPRLAGFLLYTQTGREPVTAPTVSTTTAPAPEPEPEPEPLPKPEQPTVTLPTEPPVFTAEDMDYLEMHIQCRRDPDLEELLTRPLEWDLTGDEPTVLIIHTHGTEAYTPTNGTTYQEYGGSYRTDDDRYNMVSVGEELARLLENAGISVLHDRTPYDLDDYVDSYEQSRAAVKQHLQEHPSIRMVLDLHRDAAEYADGSQWAATATVDGQSVAQLMLVVGTNATGLNHPNWESNLSFAEKLLVLMEKDSDGITRYINLRGARFNHDLSPGAIIVEVGAAGNTHEEALRAMPILAQAIVALSLGSQ